MMTASWFSPLGKVLRVALLALALSGCVTSQPAETPTPDSTFEPKFYRTLHDDTIFRSGPDPQFDRYDPVVKEVVFEVLQREQDWVQVSPWQGWIKFDDLEPLPPEQAPVPPIVRKIVVEEQGLRFKIDARAALQVEEQPQQNRLLLRFPGTGLASGHVAYPLADKRVAQVQWRPGPDELQVQIDLNGPLTGYRAEWLEDGDLLFHLADPLPRSLRGLRVVLDAGHGGKDLGTVGHLGLEEKELNLRVALATQKALEARGAEVLMTRTSDTETARADSAVSELASRVEFGRHSKGHVFLSIHHNARPSVEEGKVSHGTDIYYYRPQSLPLARALVEPIADIYPEANRRYLWRSFHVIRQTDMPAVLLELNYLSNPELERHHLDQPDYPAKAAQAIVEGLHNYLKGR